MTSNLWGMKAALHNAHGDPSGLEKSAVICWQNNTRIDNNSPSKLGRDFANKEIEFISKTALISFSVYQKNQISCIRARCYSAHSDVPVFK